MATPERSSEPASAAVTPAPKRGQWALALRVASGLVFVPLLILLARAGGLAWLGFVVLQTGLGLEEFYRMARAKGLAPVRWLGFASAFVLLGLAYRPQTPNASLLTTGGLLVLLALALRRGGQPRVLESAAVTAFGVFYVGWLSAHFVLLRELPWRAGLAYSDGGSLVLYAFLVTWSCDTGAYLTGRLFGRTRPWTTISPRKTLEGAMGGLLFAVIAAQIGAATFLRAGGGTPLLTWPHALAIGVLVGICGQVGDFVESLFKRDAASGDSSDLIPGHGGVLDRFDSLYFGAPIVYHYLRAVIFQVP
ncbi:MAG TPA: phosphatidate cytidylyltransferase [Verrucomicrobiae bacterium]|jgi:phosphatidate cytidylyltransferase|nr:phosphatidate cytidylyltransferase [Verrucomicrobiae bacterium]